MCFEARSSGKAPWYMPPEISSPRILAAVLDEDRQAGGDWMPPWKNSARSCPARFGTMPIFGPVPVPSMVSTTPWKTPSCASPTPLRTRSTVRNDGMRSCCTACFSTFPICTRPLFPTDLRAMMKELLSFRHLHRHGYDLELDGVKLKSLVVLWQFHREGVFDALGRFRSELLRRATPD